MLVFDQPLNFGVIKKVLMEGSVGQYAAQAACETKVGIDRHWYSIEMYLEKPQIFIKFRAT